MRSLRILPTTLPRLVYSENKVPKSRGKNALKKAKTQGNVFQDLV